MDKVLMDAGYRRNASNRSNQQLAGQNPSFPTTFNKGLFFYVPANEYHFKDGEYEIHNKKCKYETNCQGRMPESIKNDDAQMQ